MHNTSQLVLCASILLNSVRETLNIDQLGVGVRETGFAMCSWQRC